MEEFLCFVELSDVSKYDAQFVVGVYLICSQLWTFVAILFLFFGWWYWLLSIICIGSILNFFVHSHYYFFFWRSLFLSLLRKLRYRNFWLYSRKITMIYIRCERDDIFWICIILYNFLSFYVISSFCSTFNKDFSCKLIWYRIEDIDNPMKFYGIFITLVEFFLSSVNHSVGLILDSKRRKCNALLIGLFQLDDFALVI